MKNVTIPSQFLQELLALCGPEDHELRERVLKSAAPTHPSEGVPEDGFELWWADHMPKSTQTEAWSAWAVLHQSTRPTQQGLEQAIEWPKARDVGRFGDMSPDAFIRVGLDADNDVYVSICDGNSVSDIEFCTPGGGGGRSSRTRMALIALMCAIEADNASHPAFDFWQRTIAAQAKQEGV